MCVCVWGGGVIQYPGDPDDAMMLSGFQRI